MGIILDPSLPKFKHRLLYKIRPDGRRQFSHNALDRGHVGNLAAFPRDEILFHSISIGVKQGR